MQNPPNFLRASALSEHISPVVVIPAESSSPESEHVVETDDLVDTDVPPLPVKSSTIQVFLYVVWWLQLISWKTISTF